MPVTCIYTYKFPTLQNTCFLERKKMWKPKMYWKEVCYAANSPGFVDSLSVWFVIWLNCDRFQPFICPRNLASTFSFRTGLWMLGLISNITVELFWRLGHIKGWTFLLPRSLCWINLTIQNKRVWKFFELCHPKTFIQVLLFLPVPVRASSVWQAGLAWVRRWLGRGDCRAGRGVGRLGWWWG